MTDWRDRVREQMAEWVQPEDWEEREPSAWWEESSIEAAVLDDVDGGSRVWVATPTALILTVDGWSTRSARVGDVQDAHPRYDTYHEAAAALVIGGDP